jgi:hypothetical protein
MDISHNPARLGADLAESSKNSKEKQMRLRPVSGLLVLTSLAVVTSAYSAVTQHHKGSGISQELQQTSAQEKQADPISGAWAASFFAQGSTIPATFDLKLDGTKVTGSVNSDYTGPGTVSVGSWADGKLSFTMEFEKRESIAVSATLKDGKLIGEFTTQGFTSNWEAVKK